jgi:ABC-2 type transport system ATP-binding protein
VTELAGRVLGGGYVIDVEADGNDVPERLAEIPGVVRVQALGGDRYRVDAQRDLRAAIARHLADKAELTGIYYAAPSLNEVYARYFQEARDEVE